MDRLLPWIASLQLLGSIASGGAAGLMLVFPAAVRRMLVFHAAH
jgi:hypothetical protein